MDTILVVEDINEGRFMSLSRAFELLTGLDMEAAHSAKGDVVTTLLELVHLPRHESLHGGRTHVTIGVECDHDKVACLLGSSSDHLRGKHQVGGG